MGFRLLLYHHNTSAMACCLPPPHLTLSPHLHTAFLPSRSSLRLSPSSSFVSWALRRISPYLAHGHGQQQQQAHPLSPVSFFKFGGPAPKLPAIVEAGDPVLHEPASPVPVADIPSERIQKIIDDMVAVMRAAPGVGLAAPQIGIPLQIIVLEDTIEYLSYAPKEEVDAQQRRPFDLLVFCNPKLKNKGKSTARFFEGCLSINNYRGLVERYLEVEVSGYGRDGLPIKVQVSGWQARILQHECDHLKGILYVDRLIPRTFRTAENLRLPLPAGCPKPGVCSKHGGSIDLEFD